MKTVIAIALISVSVAGCTTTSSKYVEVAGHPYKTDPSCARTEPLGTFDRKCDAPRLGYAGFSDPSMGISAPGAISVSVGGM